MYKKIIRYIDDLFFPPICPFCESIIDYEKGLVCADCIQDLPFISGKRCDKCGKEIDTNEKLCKDCLSGHHLYTQGRAVFRYEGMVASSILNFKYHGRKNYADIYAMWIERYLGDWIRHLDVDILIPVPIHKKRLKKRTYNQSELIGKILAKSLNIVFDGDSVVRNKLTSPQKKLSVSERMKNMQNAFSVTDDSFKGKNILIIDDIYTTGVTIDALSFTLLRAGANKIFFAAVSEGGVR